MQPEKHWERFKKNVSVHSIARQKAALNFHTLQGLLSSFHSTKSAKNAKTFVKFIRHGQIATNAKMASEPDG